MVESVQQAFTRVEPVNARLDLAGNGELLPDADDLAAVLAVDAAVVRGVAVLEKGLEQVIKQTQP